jgi:hypothetical protein
MLAGLHGARAGEAAPSKPPAQAKGAASVHLPVVIDHVRFFPAPHREKAMVGGKFTGSNVSSTAGFQILGEITATPNDGEWNELSLPNTAPYRWIRYEAPPGSHGNIAELELYAGQQKIAGRGFGTAGSVAPGGPWNTAFDGKTETWFNSDSAKDVYVGLDLGDLASTARPIFQPPPGDYPGPQQVTLKCATPGAVIRYSLDGITPGPDGGTPYTAPIPVSETRTLVAVAFKEGLASSAPADGTYLIGPLTKRTINSFHIGNSLTGNTQRFPQYVRTAGGMDRYKSFLIGGALTVKLWNAREGIDKERWRQTLDSLTLPLDHLTLQPRDFNVAEEAEYALKFIDLIREKSPDVQPWLYAEWVEKARQRPTDKGEVPSSEMSKLWPALTWEESMSAMLLYNEEVQHQIAQKDHAGKRVRIIPSDIALGWARNMIDHGELPGIAPGEASFYSTLFADQVHVNPNGSYLVDLTWYAAIYHESPEGKVLPIGTTLNADQAGKLQRLAWDVVKNYPDVGLYEEGVSPVGAPQFSPGSSMVAGVVPVTLSSPTPGAWFRYTLDGTTPTRTRGYVYCGVISVRPGMSVKAISFKSGMADSAVAEASYGTKK